MGSHYYPFVSRPFYNEEEKHQNLFRCKPTQALPTIDYEVIWIEDGSYDGTVRGGGKICEMT